MELTLYRKYRPQSFKDVIGQNHIKATLQSELETGRIAHAYLFSGPRGLGKTTTARLLAKSVNCLKRKEGEYEPCNTCDSCKEIMENHSLDIIEIDAASHTGVDNVRENIISNARFSPTSRKFKVFIIDEVHMLSISAFNALLKTLEEPPAHAIFILATTEIHKVPETIISRCQRFEFRKVSQAEIVGRLNYLLKEEKVRVDQGVIENVAYYSGGCLRDAESMLGQILSLGDKEISAEQAELVLPRSRFDDALELIEFLNRQDASSALVLINELANDGAELDKFSAELLEVLRKMMLLKISAQLATAATLLSKDSEKRLAALSEKTNLAFLTQAIDIFMKRKQELRYSQIPQLPLELAVLELINQPECLVPFNPKKQTLEPEKGEPENIEKKIVEIKNQDNLKANEPVKKNSKNQAISFEEIKEKWAEILTEIKKYNQSLASVVRICKPIKLDENGSLEICSEHKFNQQRINDTKNRQILEKVFEEIMGSPLGVRATVSVEDFKNSDFQYAVPEKKEDDSVKSVLDMFGGQLL